MYYYLFGQAHSVDTTSLVGDLGTATHQNYCRSNLGSALLSLALPLLILYSGPVQILLKLA
jgi:hypothetical protein